MAASRFGPSSSHLDRDLVTTNMGRVHTMTASGAVPPGVQTLYLNHATVVIAATIANAANHEGDMIIKDISASGTAAHTVTLTAGTYHNGAGTVATLNARDEFLMTHFDSSGRGTTIINVGSVALS